MDDKPSVIRMNYYRLSNISVRYKGRRLIRGVICVFTERVSVVDAISTSHITTVHKDMFIS